MQEGRPSWNNLADKVRGGTGLGPWRRAQLCESEHFQALPSPLSVECLWVWVCPDLCSHHPRRAASKLALPPQIQIQIHSRPQIQIHNPARTL